MKKLIAIALLLCMIFALAACGAQPEDAAENEENAEGEGTEEGTEEGAGEGDVAAAAEYKLGMGIVVKTSSSSSEKHNAQVDATVATVVLDAEGKIVACRIDCAQNKMDVTDGQVDLEKQFQTKAELKEDYGMSNTGAVEWYLQAQNFEQYVIGKTADEVAATETTVNESGHTVAVDETLYASVSISIEDFLEAVTKACADEQGMTFTAEEGFTLGLAAISKVDASTKAATAEEEGSVNMYTEFAAVVLDKDGKILADLQDAIQPKIAITAAGEIGETKFDGTKRELKEAYGMSNTGAVEWYLQAQNFEQAMQGKTAEEINAIETVEDGEHVVFVDETLHASVSISVSGMIAVLLLAMEYAR